MITQSNQGRPRFISRIMVLPLLFLVVCAFAARTSSDSPTLSEKTVIVKDSNHLPVNNLVRLYLHKLRYPVTALKEEQEGAVWFYIRFDANGKLTEFRHYDEPLDLKGRKSFAVTVTSRPSRFPEAKEKKAELTPENKQTIFLEEVRRASEAISADTSRVNREGEYFFKIDFRIEKTAGQ